MPLPTRQYELRDEARFIARIDFAYIEQKVALEVDGYRFHSSRAPWYRDRARLNELTMLGWRFLLITDEMIRDEPAETLRKPQACWV